MKRSLDLIVSSLFLGLLSPVMAVVAVLVRVLLGRPVIFTQSRPGWKCNIFTIYKFRTMTNECDDHGDLLPPDQRLTRFGRMLRRSSLDELPQLFNVLQGDLSLVGPRPLRVEYLPLYNATQMRRHCVRPGMTGWAQIHGRNALSWEEKFELDVWYVDHQTFRLDLLILSRTALRVLRSEGVEAGGSRLMRPFTGTPEVGPSDERE